MWLNVQHPTTHGRVDTTSVSFVPRVGSVLIIASTDTYWFTATVERFEYTGWEYTGMDLDEEEEDAAAEGELNEEEVEEEEEEVS